MNMMALIGALPGAAAQGLIWGIMAIGVYITFRTLDIADLTVDGTMCTGGAVCIMMMMSGHNVWVAMLAAFAAGMLAGLATGFFHTFMGIPAILSGILTQLALWSVNLKVMGKSNQALNVDKYNLLVSLRYIKGVPFFKNTIVIVAIMIVVLIAILYWFFGTEAWLFNSCNRLQRQYGTCTGYQYKLQQSTWPDDLQWPCSPFKCPSGSVSGLCRYQYGTRRHRYRPGCRYHR